MSLDPIYRISFLPASADIFPLRAQQALADVNVAKNIARR